MVLHLGDELPAACEPVTDLVPGLLGVPEGVLVEVPGTAQTARGKLLLASRKDAYVSLFQAQDVTVCQDEVPAFAQANTLLRLPLIGQFCSRPYRLGLFADSVFGPGIPPPDEELGRTVRLVAGGGPVIPDSTRTPSPGSFVGNLWRLRRLFLAQTTYVGDIIREENVLASGSVLPGNTLSYAGFTCDDVVNGDPGTGDFFNAQILYVLEVQCHGEWP